ncbi:MAG: response regulator [Candidatus Omnitrophica bacterium]|nr:response regulator [Candidatus Omnitrophota bacterium]
MDEFFTTFEVAKLCYVSPGTVIRWIREGKLPAAVTAGGHRRVRWEDLLVLLNSMKMPIPDEFMTAKNTNGSKGIKMLIVDDEMYIRKMIRFVIANDFPEIEVEEAVDGFSAGWKAFSHMPDLIILDIRLPGMDGFRICELIRKMPELKHTKIIAITGLPESETKEKIMKLGADDYLVKPFDLDELKNKIVEQIGERLGRKNRKNAA